MKIFVSLAKEDYKWAQSINDYAFRIPSLKQLEIWSAALDGLDNTDDWEKTITKEIKECDGAIVLLSKASITNYCDCALKAIIDENKDIRESGYECAQKNFN